MHPLLRIRPLFLASLLKRLLGVERELARTADGLLFRVDPVSRFGEALQERGIYERELSAVFRCLIGPQDAVLDVGANEGYFTVLAASLTSGLVVAVEPQSRCAEVLQDNLALNPTGEVQVHRVALGDRCGSGELCLSSDVNPGAASLVTSRPGWSRERVELVTLDALAQQCHWGRFRLIKLDCEGSEESILRGATEFLRGRQADFISVDYHTGIVGEGAALRIDDLLRCHGYELAQAGNGCWLYHLPGLQSQLLPLGSVLPIGPELKAA